METIKKSETNTIGLMDIGTKVSGKIANKPIIGYIRAYEVFYDHFTRYKVEVTESNNWSGKYAYFMKNELTKDVPDDEFPNEGFEKLSQRDL